MKKIREYFSGIGLKEFVYLIFLFNVMYTFPTLLYKEYRKNDYNAKEVAGAMYLFVIPVAVFLLTMIYAAFTGYVAKTTVLFIVSYFFTVTMPYVTVASFFLFGIGYVVIALLGSYAGTMIFDAIGKKAVDKVNDIMDKADGKSLEKQKKKMAVKIKEEAKSEGIRDKAMKNVDTKKK